MVQKLNKPRNFCSVNYLKDIYEDRKRGNNSDFFEKINLEWKRRIAEYRKNNGNPELITSVGMVQPADSSKLTNLYSANNINLSHVSVIKKWRNYWKKELTECPCCGELGTPNTLDHYLPKVLFPEYSILLSNLVIMCDACQGVKLSNYLIGGKKIFFHNYFDNLDQRLFQLRIVGAPLNPDSFTIEPYQNLVDDVKDQVARHIVGLGLVERFSNYCTAEYPKIIEEAKICNREGENYLAAVKLEIKLQKSRSVNRWPIIFKEGLLGNQSVKNMLSTIV